MTLRSSFLSFLLLSLCALLRANNSLLAQPAENSDSNLNQILTASTIDGKNLYLRFCANCHGDMGIPPQSARELFRPSPLSLTEAVLRYGSDLASLEESVRDGRGETMLAFKNILSDAQIRAVANYVLELRGAGQAAK